MKKTPALLALALLAVGPAAPARAYDQERMGTWTHEREPRVDAPKEFRRWADQRITKLHRDFAAAGEAIAGKDEGARRQASGTLDGLKRRLSQVEGRVVGVGDSDTPDAWKERRGIRSELKGLRRDCRGLLKELRKNSSDSVPSKRSPEGS